MRRKALLSAVVVILAAIVVLAGFWFWKSDNDEEGPQAASRWLVVGLDGADWSAIERLWGEGRLPNLEAIARRGVAGGLVTDYGLSPVIWTTVATGHTPPDHGITNFVIPTEAGDVPVSSTLRKVPALWNMVTSAGLRVAAIGWWASWPAEQVNGVLISDRALMGVPDRVWPPEFLDRFTEGLEEAKRRGIEFDIGTSKYFDDTAKAHFAVELANEDFDLMMVYLRSIDLVSHTHWKYFEPQRFPEISPEEQRTYGPLIPDVYEANDRAIGSILAALPDDTNVLVLSDHGFRAAGRETVKIFYDFDRVLERLGMLVRGPKGVDREQSAMYTFNTPHHEQHKLLRLGREAEDASPVDPELQEAARVRLAEALATVTYESGAPAFRVRLPDAKEAGRGAELLVEVLKVQPSRTLLIGGEPLQGAVRKMVRYSGRHTARTHGVVFAAGPDIAAGPVPELMSIHDITPTLLYGLGLPVAEDFSGTARVELFTSEFRNRIELRSIPTWGTRQSGEALATDVDDEIADELRALGYLN